MKTVIGGIIGGAIVVGIVLSIVILMPIQIEVIQDHVKKSSPIQDIHPCQQITIDWINIINRYEPDTKLSDIEVYEVQLEYEELIKKKINCEKYAHQWRTPEFIEKIEPMIQKMQEKSDASQRQQIDEYRQKTQSIGDFFWKEIMAYDKNQARINNDCNALRELYDQVSKDLLEVSYNDDGKRTFGIPWSTARDTLQEIEKTYANTCMLEGSKIIGGSNSKCSVGTIFDEVSNSCVLK